MARTVLGLALGIAAVAAVVSTPTRVQTQEELDRKPTKCLLANQILRTQGVDQRTVVLALRGNKFYRSDLPGVCAKLEPGDDEFTFHYKTNTAKLTRLCDTDSFSIDRKPQSGCRFGQFTPITADEFAGLTGAPGNAPAPAAQPPAAQ
jgi:hypothetical protein